MKYVSNLRWSVIAGLCGGLAEVIWIGAFSLFSDTQLATVGREITATVIPSIAATTAAPGIGLAIHFGLSVLLALGFGALIWPLIQRLNTQAGTLLAAVVTLALVWKVNFYLILPVWNAGFIELLPLPVTLASKLMFGVAMGLVLMRAPRPATVQVA